MKIHSQEAAAEISPREMEEPDEIDLARKKLIEASLCVNCRHLWECVFPMKTAAPVFECEMHECGPSATPALILLRMKKQPADGSPRSGDNEPQGLCTNCENLPHCRLPKNPGGVWHCEEYE